MRFDTENIRLIISKSINPFIYSCAVITCVWIAGDDYLAAVKAKQYALNVRTKYEAEIAASHARRTAEMVSLLKGDKPVARFGCPVKGKVYAMENGERKRVC